MCRVRNNVTTGFITPQEYATRWYTQRTNGVITLSGQYFKYNSFAENAYPNKLNYSNNQFSDKFVGSVWQNPYEEKQLFAMTSSIVKYKGYNFQVKLPSNLFLTNYPATFQNIQVDFSDGLGYRIVSYDQLINVSYTQNNTYIWKYKITLTNGQTLLSHSKIEIEEGLNAAPYTSQNNTLAPQATTTTSNLSAYQKITITATTPYGDGPYAYGNATVYIKYKTGGNTITKPLIVAEGFDTGVILTPEQEAGDNNIDYFLRDINNSFSNLPIEINQYDIIYVDWNNGVDFIQKNAFVLEEVIKWVNQNKSGSQQNVVLGQSMGGLVARYALKDMENKGLNHDTRLYVSHDAPHLGANTPLSIQYSARHLRNMYITTPIAFTAGDIILPLIQDFAKGFSQIINFFGGNTSSDSDIANQITPLQAFSIADVPAARQMQYNWVNRSYGINNVIHDAWQQELSNLGYPIGYPAQGKPIRNIAIANGSECGVTQVNNGNIMSYVKDAGRNTFLSNYIGIMDFFYGSMISNPLVASVGGLFPGKSYWQVDFQSKYMTTLNENKNIYHGSIKYKKKVFWFIPVSITITEKDVNQPSGILPYDIYGGGYQKSPTDNVPLDNIVSNSFGFIPTASSLDIGKGTTIINDLDYRNSYVGALPPASPKNSPFQNFVTHFDRFNPSNNNSNHISFNRRNGNWLAKELLNTPINTNCSFICNDAKITGVDNFCLSGNFSVTNVVTTYNWTLASNNLASITSGQGTNNITISATNPNIDGFITLNCYLGNIECGYTTLTKRVHIGKPTIENFIPINGAYSWVARGFANNNTVYVNPIEATTSYKWEITMDNEDFLGYDCTGVTNPSIAKFNNNNSFVTPTTSAVYISNSPNANINWGRCSGNYILTLTAINECGETFVSSKYVTVGKPEDNPCDNSSTFSTSRISTTPNPIEEDEIIVINIAPNMEPFDLTFSSGEIGAINKEIIIYDIQGVQKYYNNLPVVDEKINVANHGLKKGHYIIHVKSPNGHIKKGHIIIKKTN